MDITQLLTFAHREGASDVHLSSGEPPMVRIHGDMKKIEHPALSAEEVHTMVFDIMSDAVRKTFQETNDVDFSFELGEHRPLSRQRVPHPPRRGRGVPNHPHPGHDAGRARAAADHEGAVREGEGAGAGHRADRLRKVDHAGRDDRLHQ